MKTEDLKRLPFKEMLLGVTSIEGIYSIFFELPKYTTGTDNRTSLLEQLGQRACDMDIDGSDRQIRLNLLSTLASAVETSRLTESSMMANR